MPDTYSGDWHQPGLTSEVGLLALAIAFVLLLFILSTVGARYLLSSSKRLSPATRRWLELLAALARPRTRISPPRGRRGADRRTDTPHETITLAPSSGDGEAAMGAGPLQQVERPRRGRSVHADLALRPEESWPFYAEDEIAAAIALLQSGKVNQWTGTKVVEFEQAYNRLLRNGRSIALANGSVALELALRAFGIGPGDEVVVTPRSFVASAFCVRLVGATPVFADIDRDGGVLTAASIEAVLTPRTKAVIPVHLGGWPADMPAIAALARAHGLRVIEDCAQAHGAEIDGYPVGSFADAAAFSFCQDKIISTGGEGGLVNFRDDQAYEWAWSFKDHGKNRARAQQRGGPPGFRWLHDSVGTNWRMTEIAAAIGLLQLDKLSVWRSRRAANAAIWADALAAIPGMRAPLPPLNYNGAFYKFYAYVDADPAANEALRDRILAEASAAGLRALSGSCSEIYREAAFGDLQVEPLPVARELGATSLMFEVHPTLEPRRQRDRADAMAEIVRSVLR